MPGWNKTQWGQKYFEGFNNFTKQSINYAASCNLPGTHLQSRLNQLYFQSRILLTLKWNYVFTNDLVYFAKNPATAVFQQITGFRIINRPHGTLQTQTL